MTNLGFVGLGSMGGRIAKRLLVSGYRVSGYNRTRSKAESLIEAGLQWKNSPRQVAEAADITFSMVTDTAALSSITEGDDGILAGLSSGKIYVDMSTVSPKLIRLLAGRVADTGARMLEAPVSGSIPAAESGTLILYVGGDAQVLDTVQPVFEQMSQKVIHVGGNGQAIVMKLAINLNLAPQLISLFEGILLAERSGIPRQAALDALLNSVAASTAMKYRAPFMLKMPDEVWFSAEMMKKDIQLALDLGADLGVQLQTAELADQMLTKAIELGWGGEDFAVLYRVVEYLSVKNPQGEA